MRALGSAKQLERRRVLLNYMKRNVILKLRLLKN